MKLKKTYLLLGTILMLATSSFAQYLKFNNSDVFPLDQMRLNRNGWIIGVGPTYMVAYPGQTQTTNFGTIKNKYITHPSGRFGFMAEIGWFHSFKTPIWFHFMDIDLGYKTFNGTEDFTTETGIDNPGHTKTSALQSFNDKWVSLNVNFTRVWQPATNFFITNAIGADADYSISRSLKGDLTLPKNDALETPADFLADIHYKFGIGWHALPRLLIVPTIEVPIFSCLPFNNIISTKSYLNSRYRPFLLSIRFMIIRKKNVKCPPVYDPASKVFPMPKGAAGKP